MRVSSLLPYLLAGATLLLLGANALPTTQRRLLLLRERASLRERLRDEERLRIRLEAELDALARDPFVLQRAACEAWRRPPPGLIPWRAGADPRDPPE
ncbi:MAG: hypothetical protein ACT4PV_06815 [Planctomycetaceae bacterium]